MNPELSWFPSTTIELLQQRAHILAQIRTFFTERFYLEVDTPVMAHHGVTDVYLSNIKAWFRNKPYSLQTSPEYHMKRLLAAGSGPIFQIARVFRDDELGRWHNPEFTLLEWYQLGINHHQLMDEMDLLLQTIMNCSPMIRKTYKQAFKEACDIDPFTASIKDLDELLEQYHLADVLAVDEQDKDQYLFLLMSHVVEPFLGKQSSPVAVYDFPPSQASLAQIKDGFAERFEVYYRGVELANGFHELIDAKAQAARFEQDLQMRKQQGLDLPDPDLWLLEALQQGIPPCSGVALGIERLLALTLEKSSISAVMAFDFSRA
ncbi:MAG: elongation factor P--(R)-beta-lysine ligase [bacterium]|nr:elongation factor P--(R)-beta-lysine ligase [bacterium]